MTRHHRRRLRRIGRWCVDHHLRTIGLLLYEFAVIDAEQELGH